MSVELAKLSQARDTLAVARTLDEVKSILDIAVAAKSYAQARKLGEESVRYAQEIVNRASRRMGEMLADTPKQNGARPPDTGSQRATPLSELGVSKHQSSRVQQLARIPESVFEAAVDRPQNRLLRIGREVAARERRSEPVDPVTASGGVEIRHGDFRDVLDDVESGSVDAIITDPPYPREYWPLYGDLGKLAARVLKPNGVLAVMTGTRLEMLDAVSRFLAEHMRPRHHGVFLTPGPRWRDHAERVATGYKPILVYAHPDAKMTDLDWIQNDVYTAAGSTRETAQQFHHWGQSEPGFADLLGWLTQPGQLVCDPFLGGGTTAVVCRDLGRRFIGCDIDPAAVHTARQRLQNGGA